MWLYRTTNCFSNLFGLTMEFLDRLGNFFTGLMAAVERVITRLFGSSNERRIRSIGYRRDKDGNATIVPDSTLDEINKLEPKYEQLSDEELKQTASILRKRLEEGDTLDGVLPDAFAAVRESSKRNLKMRHYDVQMAGGYILHQGMIAEMTTGEGKTLVSTLPAFLNALAGHVHVITVNDYLALRDMEWMGPVHIGLGLTVGAIQANMRPSERQKHYACDITYGTNNEFGFDYLRDNMKPTKKLQVQGPLQLAIVDEIDNILIDEARTPLIISGPASDDPQKYSKANTIVLQLKKGVDFEVKEKEHSCHLTDEGIRHAEQLVGVESFYTVGNMEWPHLLDNALKAHHLYKLDVNYVVRNGAVVIVDEFTGRLMEGRQWSDGLHQAVEAKEGVRIKEETQTLATITLQNYFKLYNKLAGMTGTAMTEADEFWKIYKLDVTAVPTNRPLHRENFSDVIYRTEPEKWDAIVEEIREIHATGRPILVGTVSIEKSEIIAKKLGRFGITHNVLNAKHHEREAEIIAQAGRKSAVTIATNMAGRGTDIILGGNPEHMAWEEMHKTYASRLDVPKSVWDETTAAIAKREGMTEEGKEVAALGGLHVIGTERHDSRRIDLQLRGRSGRQGDPGSSRFFLSLEDDLMRIFAGEWVKNILGRLGMEEGEAIESRLVSRQIQGAQKKREETHFESRKHLLEYDEVMDEQRKQVYSYRQRILDGANCRNLVMEQIDRQVDHWVRHFLASDYPWEAVVQWAGQEAGIECTASDVRNMDKGQLITFLKDEARRQGEDLITDQIGENLPDDLEEREWNWQALSKWTNSRWGLNTNDRELKKIGREDIQRYLNGRMDEAVTRAEFDGVEGFLDPAYARRSLASWVLYQYSLAVDPDDFEDQGEDDAIALLREKLARHYEEKEVSFPTAVGMSNFLTGESTSGDKYDREGLLRWVNSRFQAELKVEDLRGKSLEAINERLNVSSEQFLQQGRVIEQLDEMLAEAFPDVDAAVNGRASVDAAKLDQLIAWANQSFAAEFNADELSKASAEEVCQRVLNAYDARFRPELCQAERSLLLEVLDTAWKDHLYHMDHLRSGIGLVGYAQKDPKVEYKRQGMKAFEQMWDGIGEQVTSAVFRMEIQSPEFVGSLWNITGTVHEQAPADDASSRPESGQSENYTESGQESKAIDPIRNKTPKVGRNDPCPRGSGKKYKKCHGAA